MQQQQTQLWKKVLKQDKIFFIGCWFHFPIYCQKKFLPVLLPHSVWSDFLFLCSAEAELCCALKCLASICKFTGLYINASTLIDSSRLAVSLRVMPAQARVQLEVVKEDDITAIVEAIKAGQVALFVSWIQTHSLRVCGSPSCLTN